MSFRNQTFLFLFSSLNEKIMYEINQKKNLSNKIEIFLNNNAIGTLNMRFLVDLDVTEKESVIFFYLEKSFG